MRARRALVCVACAGLTVTCAGVAACGAFATETSAEAPADAAGVPDTSSTATGDAGTREELDAADATEGLGFCEARAGLLLCDDFDPRDGEAPFAKWTIWGNVQLDTAVAVSPPASMLSTNAVVDGGVPNGIVQSAPFDVVDGQTAHVAFDVRQTSPAERVGSLLYLHLYGGSPIGAYVQLRYDAIEPDLVVEVVSDPLTSDAGRQTYLAVPGLTLGKWVRVALEVPISSAPGPIKLVIDGKERTVASALPTLPAGADRLRLDLGVGGSGNGDAVAHYDNVTLDVR